jgi:hypothetical protein
MREEQIPMATGASAGYMDRSGLEACGQQLAAIGFDQIQMQAGADVGMAGSALGQEQHGIFGSHRIGRVDIVE